MQIMILDKPQISKSVLDPGGRKAPEAIMSLHHPERFLYFGGAKWQDQGYVLIFLSDPMAP